MPKYFFNTRMAGDLLTDSEGRLLRDPDHVWETARAIIADLLRSQGAQPALLNATIEVTDAAGDIVLEFPFSEALLDTPDRSVTRQ